VHHGSAGTTTTATRAGAPQVAIPQWADQPYWASRVAGLGIDVAHDVQAPTTESLSAALSTALTPRTRASDRRGRHDPHRRDKRWPRRCCSTRSAGKRPPISA